MNYKVKAKVQLEAEFLINDEQLINYFGQEKFCNIETLAMNIFLSHSVRS